MTPKDNHHDFVIQKEKKRKETVCMKILSARVLRGNLPQPVLTSPPSPWERRRVLFQLRASPSSSNSGTEDDNNEQNSPQYGSSSEEIQEDLIKSLQFEIGAKRNLDQHVKESGDKLKAIAEEAKEEMDRAAELAKLRGDLAFDSALADINREADKFERKLRQRREAMEQEREEMKAWVRDVEDSRNEGQFFGNLYGDLVEEEEESKDGRKRFADMDPYEKQEVMERRRRVIEPAEEEIKSPARMYIFMVLGGMLLVNVVSDVCSEQGPSWGLDGLYCVLASIACWIVVSERKALETNT